MKSIDVNFVFEIIETVALFSSTTDGCTRPSYSKEDQEARDYLVGILAGLNLSISTDAAGNLHARYTPSTVQYHEPIVIGSHIDTVPNGGKYDGVLGVAVAIEVVRTIIHHKIAIFRPIEVIIYAEEEGSNFGITSLGSKLMTGQLEYNDLVDLRSFAGIPAIDLLRDFGLDPRGVPNMETEEIHAFLELHIEQGPVLDRENVAVGIVNSIVGQHVYCVKVLGESNHAGTTPMDARKDAVLCAASIVSKIPEMIRKCSENSLVGTVGRIEVFPNGTNVIASEVHFWIDLRGTQSDMINKFIVMLEDEIYLLADKYKCSAVLSLVGSSEPIVFSEAIVRCLQGIANELNIKHLTLSSGAGHDCGILARIAPSGMIFIRSPRGISHSPLESVFEADVLSGANIMLNAVIALATRKIL